MALLPTIRLLYFSHLFFYSVPWALKGMTWMFQSGTSTWQSPVFIILPVTDLYITHCLLQTKVYLTKTEDSIVYGDECKYLAGSLKRCPFSKTRVLGSTLLPMISSVTDLWWSSQYQIWTPSWLILNHISWLPSLNSYAIIALISTFCLAIWYCSKQGLRLGKLTADISLPAACIATSGTAKSYQHRGSFQFSSSMVSCFSATKVCSIFSDRKDLLIQFWWATKDNYHNLYGVGRPLQSSCPTTPRVVSHPWSLDFLWIIHDFWNLHHLPGMASLLKVFLKLCWVKENVNDHPKGYLNTPLYTYISVWGHFSSYVLQLEHFTTDWMPSGQRFGGKSFSQPNTELWANELSSFIKNWYTAPT